MDLYICSKRELFNTVANKENLKLITTEKDFYHLSQVTKLIEKLLQDFFLLGIFFLFAQNI